MNSGIENSPDDFWGAVSSGDILMTMAPSGATAIPHSKLLCTHTHLTSLSSRLLVFLGSHSPTLFLVNTADCEASGTGLFGAVLAGGQPGRARPELQEPSRHALSNTPWSASWATLGANDSLPRMIRFLKPLGVAS